MKRQTCYIDVRRHPNTNLRQRLEARLEATDRAARLARPVVVSRWLEGSMKYDEDGQPIRDGAGKLNYDACRSAVDRARKLGLIG